MFLLLNVMHVCAPQGKAGLENAGCQAPQHPWVSAAQRFTSPAPSRAAHKEVIGGWVVGMGSGTSDTSAAEHIVWLTEASNRPEVLKFFGVWITLTFYAPLHNLASSSQLKTLER